MPGCAASPSRCYFNSRPSARGDGEDDFGAYAFKLFQFTPPREGRLGPVKGKHLAAHFNSRPPARGDGHQRCKRLLQRISIHAPPRGATAHLRKMPIMFVFQFTPLREGRLIGTRTYGNILAISIHAPPRGATTSRKRRPPLPTHFNSRPSARGDDDKKRRDAVVLIFQFPPLREGRHVV